MIGSRSIVVITVLVGILSVGSQAWVSSSFQIRPSVFGGGGVGFVSAAVSDSTTTTTTSSSSSSNNNNNNNQRLFAKRTTTVTPSTLPPITYRSLSKNTKLFGSSRSIGQVVRRVRDSFTSKERTNDDLKIGIAGFYDRSSKLWEEVWGEHMHHGYYIPSNRTDHQQAQIDLIDEVLKWAYGVTDSTTNSNTPTVKRVVDVGCGIGGSSRHIAKKLGASTEGITLSPYQAQRGNELAIEQQVQKQCTFRVADALHMPFTNNSFDLVWSLESGEHMPNKRQFVNELFRVAEPGGRIIIVTWCHRDLNTEQNETSLKPSELRLLRRINRAYYLPQWCSVQDYVQLLKENGASDIRTDDWSYIIAPFWKAVIRSSLNIKSIIGLLRAGFSTQRGAFAMLLMLKGFNDGLIKFGLLTCTKPLLLEKDSTTTRMESVEGETVSLLNNIDIIDP